MKRVAQFRFWRRGGPDQNGMPYGMDDLPDRIAGGICTRAGWWNQQHFDAGDYIGGFDPDAFNWSGRLAAIDFRAACRSFRQSVELIEVGYRAALYDDLPYGLWDALFQARYHVVPESQLRINYRQLDLLDEGVRHQPKTENVVVRDNIL